MKNDGQRQKAFTLYEVMAVMGLLAVLALMAIAVPRQFEDKTNEVSARSAIEQVVAAQRQYAMSGGTWTDDATELQVGSGVTITTDEARDPGFVSIALEEDMSLVVATVDAQGKCYAARVNDPLSGAEMVEMSLSAQDPCWAEFVAGKY